MPTVCADIVRPPSSDNPEGIVVLLDFYLSTGVHVGYRDVAQDLILLETGRTKSVII